MALRGSRRRPFGARGVVRELTDDEVTAYTIQRIFAKRPAPEQFRDDWEGGAEWTAR